MRGLIFLGLLACVHGLGPVYIYENAVSNLFSGQTAAQWVLASTPCVDGTKQSPIDIDTKAAKMSKTDPGPVMAYGFGADRPMEWRVDGKTTTKPVGLTMAYPTSDTLSAKTGTAHAIITGGPLEQPYQFSHVEFHYGSTADTKPGAEHTFDGTRPQMSMNVIFTKTEWTAAQETLRNGLGSAINYDLGVYAAAQGTIDPAGVAVIAYSIDIGDKNEELQPLLSAITRASTNAKTDPSGGDVWPQTTDLGATKQKFVPGPTHNVNMSALMKLDEGALEDYYYYDGSLTLPTGVDASSSTTLKAVSCAEIVRWILPTKRLTMTAAQMNIFNSNSNFAHISSGTGVPDAFARNVQTGAKIADITVMRRMPIKTTDDAIWRNLASTLLSVGTFGLVHNMLTQDETAKALTENPVVDILQDIEQRFVRPAVPQERQSFNHHHHPQDIQY